MAVMRLGPCSQDSACNARNIDSSHNCLAHEPHTIKQMQGDLFPAGTVTVHEETTEHVY